MSPDFVQKTKLPEFQVHSAKDIFPSKSDKRRIFVVGSEMLNKRGQFIFILQADKRLKRVKGGKLAGFIIIRTY